MLWRAEAQDALRRAARRDRRPRRRRSSCCCCRSSRSAPTRSRASSAAWSGSAWARSPPAAGRRARMSERRDAEPELEAAIERLAEGARLARPNDASPPPRRRCSAFSPQALAERRLVRGLPPRASSSGPRRSRTPPSALTAIATLLAEETRIAMMVGVTVGWALAEELDGELRRVARRSRRRGATRRTGGRRCGGRGRGCRRSLSRSARGAGSPRSGCLQRRRPTPRFVQLAAGPRRGRSARTRRRERRARPRRRPRCGGRRPRRASRKPR